MTKCRCNIFIATENDKKTCECGLTEEEHHNKDAFRKSNIKQWNSAYCTTDDGITNAFGDITFLENSDFLSKVSLNYYKKL